jgi:hypothetical protein
MTPLGHVSAALIFAVSAILISHDAHRQQVPPLDSLQTIERTQVATVHVGENVGLPILRDEYVEVEFVEGGAARYREWYPQYRTVKHALLSPHAFRIWIGTDDHFRSIYQVESKGQLVATYEQVTRRMQLNIVALDALALLMGLGVAPYYVWSARREYRRSRAPTRAPR